jgi:2-alkyl-3-oxoalkanoate reductase
MNVFITGATGVLGKRVVKKLLESNHKVSALCRSETNVDQIRKAGAVPVSGNLFDRQEMISAANGCDAIFHLATHIPKKNFPNKKSDWIENDKIRQDGTRNLLDAALENNIKVFIQQSITTAYGDKQGAWVDETSPLDNDPIMMVRSAIEMEQMIREQNGTEYIILRFGTFYGKDAFNTQNLLKQIKKRSMPIIGKGENYLNFIHLDDAASTIVHVFENFEQYQNRTVNVTDFHPIRSDKFLNGLADLLKVKRPFHLPVFLARFLFNKSIFKYVTHSYRIRKSECLHGWEPAHENVLKGLEGIIHSKNLPDA